MAVKKTATKKTAAKKPVAKKPVAKKAPEAKKPEAKKPAAKKPAAKKAAAKKKLTGEARYSAVREAAYYIAEASGFTRDNAECWSEAEAQIKKQFGS